MVSGEFGFRYPERYRFLNRGVHGNRLPQLLTRLHADVIDQKPDFLTILVGINDLFHEYTHNITDGRKRYEAYYRLLLDEIKNALCDSKVILMSPFAFSGDYLLAKEWLALFERLTEK